MDEMLCFAADNNWHSVTKYDIYSKRIKSDIAELNCEQDEQHDGRGVQWGNRSMGLVHHGDERRYDSCPFLEFVHNEKSCLAPAGAKAVRYELRTGRRSSLPRIGAFEVVLAVYRSHEDQWREFVLFSKLGLALLSFPARATIAADL